MVTNEQRVTFAAGLLDTKHPGWHRMINTDTLNMMSCTRCIIGQVFGAEQGYHWTSKVEALLGPFSTDAENDVTAVDHACVFASISMAPHWVAAIQSRLAADAPVADAIDTEWTELQRTAVQPVYV